MINGISSGSVVSLMTPHFSPGGRNNPPHSRVVSALLGSRLGSPESLEGLGIGCSSLAVRIRFEDF